MKSINAAGELESMTLILYSTQYFCLHKKELFLLALAYPHNDAFLAHYHFPGAWAFLGQSISKDSY